LGGIRYTFMCGQRIDEKQLGFVSLSSSLVFLDANHKEPRARNEESK